MTYILPCVVMLDALKPLAVQAPVHDPPVVPYLDDPIPRGLYDIELHADFQSVGIATKVCVAEG